MAAAGSGGSLRVAMRVLGACVAMVVLWPHLVAAQTEPVIRVSCGELRSTIARHDLGSVDAIEVVARLTSVRFDDIVAYLTACSAPDPVVVCIAYGTSDRREGDAVLLRGAFEARGPDRILLDPCVHFPGGGAD